MQAGILAAIEGLEKENANLQPELLTVEAARDLMTAYVRAERLVSFGIAALSRKLDEGELARLKGSPIGRAKDIVATGKVLATSADLSSALQHGEVSLDQAVEIASAESSAPGAAGYLVAVAQDRPFQVLRQTARRTKLEAEQHRDLATRQHEARRARTYGDDLGMLHVHLTLEPHRGAPVVARAEAEAQRLGRATKAAGDVEPFERLLADAYVSLLSGSGKSRAKRPELVVLVSHEVARRGWKDVRKGEVCKIPGIGPVSPGVAREIARDAFLNGVFFDGKDLRRFARWSRNIPVEVRIALELGDPPGFDGVACVDCGNRFRTEWDHQEPHVARGPSSNANLRPRCWDCHRTKTALDRKAGKLTPPEP